MDLQAYFLANCIHIVNICRFGWLGNHAVFRRLERYDHKHRPLSVSVLICSCLVRLAINSSFYLGSNIRFCKFQLEFSANNNVFLMVFEK